jgi:hypothetical protein
MTEQSTQIESARIDELLAAYRELQSQFDRVLERLRRADEQKHTVQRRIYERVRAEYDRELDSIRARMSPLRDELDRVHETLETEWRGAGSIVQSVEEELAEAEFRHRIGEYEESAFAGLRRTLDTRAGEARSRQALLQTALAAIAAMRRPDAHDDPAPTVADATAGAETDIVVEATPEPESARVPRADAPEPEPAREEAPARRPVLNASNVASKRIDGFENPHDWIPDAGGEAARAERRRPEPPRPSAPKRAPEDELDSLLTPVSTAAAGFPSLVFVSGAHAGQAIPLVPTTLTIGREHDNNIEIKDPEVARYHARILRERDVYVVEDLNSSTGTWVNGQRTPRAVLTHGDVIRVGQTELALDFEWTTDSR